MNFIMGDTHGNLKDLRTAIECRGIKEGDRLFITGDFGFIFAPKPTRSEIALDREMRGYGAFKSPIKDYQKENEVLDKIDKIGCQILFIDGNHENFDLLEQFEEQIMFGSPVSIIRPNIIHLKRGYVYTIDGCKIFTMGGAISLDKNQRIPGKSWWPQERHTYEEQSRGIDSLIAVNWEVDFVITHTAPKQAEEMLKKGIKQQYGDSTFQLEDECEIRYLTFICENLSFEEWHFGHMHIDHDDNLFFAHYSKAQNFFFSEEFAPPIKL